MDNKKDIGLAFSGGGYRAAAFHLGTLQKMHKMGLLNRIDVMSTISGGSITGAFFALKYKGDMQAFEREFIKKLKTSTIKTIFKNPLVITTFALLIAVPTTVATLWLMFGGPVTIWRIIEAVLVWLFVFIAEVILIIPFQFKLLPLTHYTIQAYQKIFFGKAVLNNLPDTPRMAINASNLETGTLFTFSKETMGDSSYAYPRGGGDPIEFLPEKFPIATAVASSTAVPFVFNPVKVAKDFYKNTCDFGTRANPSLVDGGLYDNQGIHKLTQSNSRFHCKTVICSDGSMPYDYQFNGTNSAMVLYRATDLMMRKIKNMQFLRDVYSPAGEIAYFSMDWLCEEVFAKLVTNIEKGRIDQVLLNYYQLPQEWIVSPEAVKANRQNIIAFLKNFVGYDAIPEKPLTEDEWRIMSKIGTNLTALSDTEIDLLTRQAARLAEMHIKLYCPSLNINQQVVTQPVDANLQ